MERIMQNFTYWNPVKIVFGKGTISELTELIPVDKKVLMIYGGGSIKKNGVYDQVKKALKNHNILEFAGIEPNPLYQTCMKAVDVIKKEQIDFLLAVGGGSALDATKFIAAAAKFKGKNAWDIVTGAEIKSALPLGCVMTLPATGSEMNCGSVISNSSIKEKYPVMDPHMFPQFSILDPETTFSLPKRQVINGIIDTYIHTVEQYITFDVNSSLQDRQAEAILKTLIEETPMIMAEPVDYDARANFFWCSTQALNGLISCGVVSDWTTHMIGHELTALYGLDHGQTLAILQPRVWENKKTAKAGKLLQYARRVLNINDKNEDETINLAIKKTEDYFQSLGIKTKLSDYNIDAEEAAEVISKRFEKRGRNLGENGHVTPKDVKEILLNSK